MADPYLIETIITVLAVALTAAADGLTTLRGIRLGAYEGNPIMQGIMSILGQSGGLLVSKAVLVAGVVVAAFFLWDQWYTPVGFAALAFMQGIVAFINYRMV